MGRRLPKLNARKAAARFREGFGQGKRSEYKAWLRFNDVSSRGVTTRLHSVKLRRTMVFFSNVEKCAFLVAEFRRNFLDYQEQGLMNTKVTLELTRQIGMKHPLYRGTKDPVDLTYDGLFTMASGAQQLIDCKHSSQAGKRTSKLGWELRKRYAQHMGFEPVFITENSFTWEEIQNIQWMRMSASRRGTVPVPCADFDYWSSKLYYDILNAVDCDSDIDVERFLCEFEGRNGCLEGFGVFALRRTMWERHIDFDYRKVHFEDLLCSPITALRAGRVEPLRFANVLEPA